MYEEFFGLKARPFAAAPDPSFQFWSESHEFAFTMLRYSAMARLPITVMTGPAGVGKTTLTRRLVDEEANKALIGYVFPMTQDRGDLMRWILTALGAPPQDASYMSLFAQFQELIATAQEDGARILLIFDDAHQLDDANLEEIRMISNVNFQNQDVLQLLLVGLPELRDRINQPILHNLRQRISLDFVVNPMTAEETAGYISSRITAAGGDKTIFSPYVCKMIHDLSNGVPRSVNLVCDMCLTYAFGDEREEVDELALREFVFLMRDNNVATSFTPPKSDEAAG